MVPFPMPIPKNAVVTKDLHRDSVQKGPANQLTALTGTIFVAISVFMSRGHFLATFGSRLPIFVTFFRELLEPVT